MKVALRLASKPDNFTGWLAHFTEGANKQAFAIDPDDRSIINDLHSYIAERLLATVQHRAIAPEELETYRQRSRVVSVSWVKSQVESNSGARLRLWPPMRVSKARHYQVQPPKPEQLGSEATGGETWTILLFGHAEIEFDLNVGCRPLPYMERPMLVFRVLPLDPGHIEVEVDWSYRSLTAYVDSLVMTMRSRWPGVETMEEPRSVCRRKRLGPPRLEERDPEEIKPKRDELRQYLELRGQGVSQEVAAGRVGRSRRTLETWREHPEIGGKLDGRNS